MDTRERRMLYGFAISLMWLPMAWYCASIAKDYVKIQRYQFVGSHASRAWVNIDRLTNKTRICRIGGGTVSGGRFYGDSKLCTEWR